MKWKVLLLIYVFSVTCNSYCDFQGREFIRGNGDMVKQERPVKGVTGVKTTTFVDVRIRLGDEEKPRKSI